MTRVSIISIIIINIITIITITIIITIITTTTIIIPILCRFSDFPQIYILYAPNNVLMHIMHEIAPHV